MGGREGTYRKKRLSKTDYLAGLQCAKNLWLRINEADAEELGVGDEQEALFEQGRRVGVLARTYVPGGTLIEYPYYAVDEKLRATERALEEGVDVIYEAAFAVDGQFVAVDILERTSEGFSVTEVKSSTKVKDEHLTELALQAHVLSRSGIEVTRLQVMHLNRACAYPNLENLFVREDVTEDVKPLIAKVEEHMRAHAEVLSKSLPIVQIGPHCSAPNDCAFKNRCWADVPPHHVTTIHAMRAKKAFDLVEQGFTTIQELPSDYKLSDTAERQRRAVIDNRLIVEPTLVDALKDFPSSIGFLDFETVGLAIPVWDGCRPYDAVPVEFSLHVLQPDGTLTHVEWLADGPGDPRESIALALIDACSNVERIAAYNSGFESRCLRHLADALPNLASDLNEIESRLIDLLPVVRNHIYRPEFYGSFGLKQVFPALTGESSYERLEVAGGELASWLIQALLFEPERYTADERSNLRRDLLAYCKTDTESLAKLLCELRKLRPGTYEQMPLVNNARVVYGAEEPLSLSS
jgi:predicted RecB family nuclease